MKNFLCLCFLFVGFKVFSQNYSTSQNLEFLSYLKANNKAKDIAVFSKTFNVEDLKPEQKDSLFFYKGWSNYFTKQFDTAVFYFDKVGKESPLFESSLFHQSFCLSNIGNYADAIVILNTFVGNEMLEAYKNFSIASNLVLQKNFTLFDNYSKNFTGNYYAFAQEEEDLKKMASIIRKQKDKSPVKATLMSALVPGLGKYYAGYWGKAVSTFIPVVAFGAMATEAYFKAGPVSPQFIILGGLFSVFYVGNLYGTYYSVKIHQREIEQKNKNEILLNVHIPLRRIFN